jgi:hypothetical protein
MQVVAREDIEKREKIDYRDDAGQHLITPFLGGEEGSAKPSAFMVEFRPNPGGVIKPHFHKVAQFQIVVGGDGMLGKHDVPPFSYHYTDPSTPYGPIAPASDARGIDYITLRPVVRGGLYWMPGNKDQMDGRAGRNIAGHVPNEPLPAKGVSQDQLIERHDDGLAVSVLRLAPHEETEAPGPAGSGGQYQLTTRGSLVHEGRDLGPLALTFVAPDEHSTLTAGSEGAEVLVMQFPTKILPPSDPAAQEVAS